jgi:hypothetical protein
MFGFSLKLTSNDTQTIGLRLGKNTFGIDKVLILDGITYEPVGSSLCVQACFRAFSGFANSLTGLGKLKSAKILKSYKIARNSHDLIFRVREVK